MTAPASVESASRVRAARGGEAGGGEEGETKKKERGGVQGQIVIGGVDVRGPGVASTLTPRPGP